MVWVPSVVCCVLCGLEHKKIILVEVDMSNNSKCPLDFSLLQVHVKEPLITDFTKFLYGSNVIDGAILDRMCFKSLESDCVILLQICDECHSALKSNHVPCLLLANNLYIEKLPSEFLDLTWVEEMVCVKYQNTAHVTCIYGSSDLSQPTSVNFGKKSCKAGNISS